MTKLLFTFAEISLPVSGVIALLLLLQPLMRRRYAARWRYWAWLVLAVRLLVPINFTLPAFSAVQPVTLAVPHIAVFDRVTVAPQQQNAPETQTYIAQHAAPLHRVEIADIPTQAPSSAPAGQSPAPVQVETRLTLADAAAWMWAAVAVLLLCWNAAQYVLARRSLLRAARTDAAATEAARRIAAVLGMRRCPPVLRAPAAAGPLLLGVLRPCILLPATAYDAQSLAMILHHELIHQKRHDIAYKLFLQIVCCVHWFNPLVWGMTHFAARDVEISCDDAVLHGQNDVFRTHYADSILAVLRASAGKAVPCSTAFGSTKETLRQRFTNIFDKTKKHSGLVPLALITAICVAVTGFVACTAAPAQSAAESPSAGSETEAALSPGNVPKMAMLVMELFENYCSSSFYPLVQDGVTNYGTGITLAYGFLTETNQLEPYRAEAEQPAKGEAVSGSPTPENYTVYKIDNQALAGFFLETPSDEYAPWSWGRYENESRVKVTLTPISTETAENGDLVVRCARRLDGKEVFYDAIYTLRPHTAQEVPPELTEYLQPGDTYYTLINLKNSKSETDSAQTIEIGTVEDLLAMAAAVNSDPAHLVNTYLLTNDLDLTGVEFTPIGNTLYPFGGIEAPEILPRGFNGVFDGQGHTITGLTIVEQDKEYEGGHGFFGYIGPQGVVKNLNLTNASITSGWGPRQMWDETSGILAVNCSGTVENCHVQGIVEGGAMVGGLIGEVTGMMALGTSDALSEKDNAESSQGSHAIIKNCSADVAVRGTNEVGALFGGLMYANVTDCTATGSLYAMVGPTEAYSMPLPAYIGGFAGFYFMSNAVNCDVDVKITYEQYGTGIGAFGGDANGSTAENCTYNPAKTGDLAVLSTSNGYRFTDYTGYDIKPKA